MKIEVNGSHLVPLSKLAVSILTALKSLISEGRYVFPSVLAGQRPMSDNTVNAALRRFAFTRKEIIGHGFRAVDWTILDEHLKIRPDCIEHQLAYAVRTPHGRAYSRTIHLKERLKVEQKWADYRDKFAANP